MLNKFSAAALELQQQFREAVTAAAAVSSTGSGCKSVPQSPRAAVGPHITRPHSALRVRCNTPTEPEQHLPMLKSPCMSQSSSILLQQSRSNTGQGAYSQQLQQPTLCLIAKGSEAGCWSQLQAMRAVVGAVPKFTSSRSRAPGHWGASVGALY